MDEDATRAEAMRWLNCTTFREPQVLADHQLVDIALCVNKIKRVQDIFRTVLNDKLINEEDEKFLRLLYKNEIEIRALPYHLFDGPKITHLLRHLYTYKDPRFRN